MAEKVKKIAKENNDSDLGDSKRLVKGDVKERRRHYETIFVLSPTASDNDVKEILNRFTKVLEETKAVILRQDDWGKKRMAYMIEKHNIGRYFYYRYAGTGQSLKALERLLKIEAACIRFLSVRLSEPLSEQELSDLQERAPKEASFAPSIRSDDDFDSSEAGGFN